MSEKSDSGASGRRAPPSRQTCPSLPGIEPTADSRCDRWDRPERRGEQRINIRYFNDGGLVNAGCAATATPCQGTDTI
ncbi:hypothetical protein AAFF_G00304060 [Aldrovandia affinis]|uniref:Uncharacterized protein n=1 Tax=Aldrovandia affinis TaxID=143900 RepID=A0AAD7SP45_9TELE|nr:hypothetical protein AAFF_G00304060 [Aldrovandia affinis]